MTVALPGSTLGEDTYTARTLEMCVPSLRCTPEQSRHSSTPRLTAAQVTESGSAQPQSAQHSLPGLERSVESTRCACNDRSSNRGNCALHAHNEQGAETKE